MTEKKPMRTNATPARTTARQPEPSPKAAAKEHLTASETPDEAIATDSPEPEAKSTPKATSKRKTEASTAVDAGVTKTLTTRLTPREHKSLKALAVEQETTTQALVRGMVQALLKRSTI